MQKIYIFRCTKINSRFGFTIDKTGGRLPVMDCNGWNYDSEIELTTNTEYIMNIPLRDVLDIISQIDYYIHETDMSIYYNT